MGKGRKGKEERERERERGGRSTRNEGKKRKERLKENGKKGNTKQAYRRKKGSKSVNIEEKTWRREEREKRIGRKMEGRTYEKIERQGKERQKIRG